MTSAGQHLWQHVQQVQLVGSATALGLQLVPSSSWQL